MATTYTMVLKGKRTTGLTLAAAKALFNAARDKSGQGASRWPDAALLDSTGTQVAYISYNGRAWKLPESVYAPNRVELV